MRKNNQQSLKEVIEAIVNQGRLKQGLTELNIKNVWNQVVGPQIANHTTDIYLKNKTLFVTLDSSVLRQEMSYGKELIVRKVNEHIGQDALEKVVLR